MEDETKQILKTAADKAVTKAKENEADKIQAVLRSGDTPKVKPKSGVSATKLQPTPQSKKVKPKSKNTTKPTLSTESRQKLNKMLTPTVGMKLSGDSRKKLQQILNLGRAAKLKVNQYISEN